MKTSAKILMIFLIPAIIAMAIKLFPLVPAIIAIVSQVFLGIPKPVSEEVLKILVAFFLSIIFNVFVVVFLAHCFGLIHWEFRKDKKIKTSTVVFFILVSFGCAVFLLKGIPTISAIITAAKSYVAHDVLYTIVAYQVFFLAFFLFLLFVAYMTKLMRLKLYKETSVSP